MLTKDALKREVSPAVYERGYRNSFYGYARHCSCSYEGKLTKLEAQVESSSNYYDERYETRAVFDERENRLVHYSCTCPAAAKYYGPCKHVVTLGYTFIDRPTYFKGYDSQRHVVTSYVLSTLLDGVDRDEVTLQTSAANLASAASLVPTLVFDGHSVFVRFRVEGPNGSYVIKNISDFADDVTARAVKVYGKRLTLRHDEATFDELSWQLAQWIVRGVRNRRAFSSERYLDQYYATSTSRTGAIMGREIRLSGPEIDEIVQMYQGNTIDFLDEQDKWIISRSRTRSSKAQKATPVTLQVEEADPQLELDIVAGSDDSFELVCRGELSASFMGNKTLYVVQDHRLLCCSKELVSLSSFIMNIFNTSEEHINLAEEDAARFAAVLLPRLERSLKVTVPDSLAALKPVPAHISFYLDRSGARVSAEVVASYGEERHPILPVGVSMSADAQRGQGGTSMRTSYRNPRYDQAAESAARQLVATYFAPTFAPEAREAWELPVRNSDAVAALVFGGVARMREMGEVYTTPAFDRLVSRSRPKVRMGLSVESNLLRLSFTADDLPLEELFALLSSYRRKKNYHRLHDGSLLDLSSLDLSEAAALADELGLTARELASGMIEMPAYKAFLLEHLVSDEEKDESFYEWLDDFRSVDLASFEPPAALAGVLRPYQCTGYQWLSALAEMGFGGILADEMGLGKTIQLIAFLLGHRGRGRSLVVCPASLVYNWLEEFGRFAPTMDAAVVAGTAAQRRAIRLERSHEILITSYDLMRRDVADYASEELFCVALDEAQFIKNHQTLASQAAKALKAHHRFALTGTPVENRLSELWSIFDFLMPGLLGGYESFRDRYEAPIVAGDEEVAARLKAAVGPFILRRLKREVLTDLPDKLETAIVARMDKEQQKLYQAHEQALRLSLSTQGDAELARGKLQVLAELTRLRQLCCDPRLIYDDYKGGSCKLDTIWELVAASVDAGAKVLVFSQFTSFLALIAERLRKEHVAFYELTGSTPKKRRLELANAFNTDDTPAFLISLKAGGTGLNLVGAQVVIHADPWWNVAAEDQATDRAHRIGQKSDVSVYKVICKGTIEERIVALQDAKADLAEAVVGEGGGQSLGSLSREDLLDLLG